MGKSYFLFLFFLFIGQVMAQDCIPRNDSCSFYTECLEENFKCGAGGYPLAYGKKYCDRFSSLNEADLSKRGIIWRDATLYCLQNSLVDILYWQDRRLQCSSLMNMAFLSHPLCYTSNGRISVCRLKVSDWKTILWAVDTGDYLSRNAVSQVVSTLKKCGSEIVFGYKSLQDRNEAQEKLRFIEELPSPESLKRLHLDF